MPGGCRESARYVDRDRTTEGPGMIAKADASAVWAQYGPPAMVERRPDRPPRASAGPQYRVTPGRFAYPR